MTRYLKSPWQQHAGSIPYSHRDNQHAASLSYHGNLMAASLTVTMTICSQVSPSIQQQWLMLFWKSRRQMSWCWWWSVVCTCGTGWVLSRSPGGTSLLYMISSMMRHYTPDTQLQLGICSGIIARFVYAMCVPHGPSHLHRSDTCLHVFSSYT